MARVTGSGECNILLFKGIYEFAGKDNMAIAKGRKMEKNSRYGVPFCQKKACVAKTCRRDFKMVEGRANIRSSSFLLLRSCSIRSKQF